MTFRHLSLTVLTVLLGLTLVSCDLLGTDNDKSSVVTDGVYVANAGTFRQGNSSLTVFDPTTQQTQHLPAEDSGFASYIQSLHLTSNRVFLLFGETNTVGVYNTGNGEQVDQISSVRNPRYMITTGSTAFVTGQDYSGSPAPKLYQVNRSSHDVVDSVNVGGSPEDVVLRGSRAYVALGGRDGTVAVVNPVSMSVTNEVAVECDNPRSMAVDQENELLVFCAGSVIYDENFEVVDRTDGAISILNASNEVMKQVPLDTMLTSESQGQRVYYAAQTDEAFAVLADQTILRFDASTNTISSRVSASGVPIGAIGYDAVREELYVGRVPGFTERGTVTIHERDGTQTGSFQAGIAPTYIDFRRSEK